MLQTSTKNAEEQHEKSIMKIFEQIQINKMIKAPVLGGMHFRGLFFLLICCSMVFYTLIAFILYLSSD